MVRLLPGISAQNEMFCVTLILAGTVKAKAICCETRKKVRGMSNTTPWGSHPSPAGSVGAVNTQRQGSSIFFSLWTLLIFQPRHRLLYSGLPLLSTDLLLLIPAVDHGLLQVRRLQLKDSLTYTLAINQRSSMTQPRDGKAEVWRETKLLPPLCKGPQLIPIDFPDGHQRDQVSDGFVCATKGSQGERSEGCGQRDTGKGRKLLGKTDPASSKKHQEGQAA